MTFKKFGVLPGKPSELIKLALKDLTKAEKAKNVEILMEDWYFRRWFEEKCYVCLAGSVMRGTMKIKPTPESEGSFAVSPMEYPEEELALTALNLFRLGLVAGGLHTLGIPLNENNWISDVNVRPYGGKGIDFRKDMNKVVKLLESKGF